MADTFSVAMSYGCSNQMRPRTKTVAFGDGYELRIGDGLNTMAQRWSLNFNVLTIGEANAVEAFFRAQGGIRWFWWTPPRQTTQIKVICKDWTRAPLEGSRLHDSITANFQQVFDLQG
jgi:phage-related protein